MKMERPTVTIDRAGRGDASKLGRSVPLHLTLTVEDFDRVYALAARERATMQDVIRAAVRLLLIDEDGGARAGARRGKLVTAGDSGR